MPFAPNLPTRLLIALVRGYRVLLSPWLGSSCRFEPTCSMYSIQAYEAHGAVAGTCLTLARIARCHPWCEGGHDAVPVHPPRLFPFLAGEPPPGASRPSPSLTDKTSP